MENIITESPGIAPGAGHLDWSPLSPGLVAFRASPADAGLAMVAKTADGLWQALVVMRGPNGSLPAGPPWFSIPVAARHGAQRWAEQAIAAGQCPPGVDDPSGDSEASAKPFKTGIPGIIEYWSQGSWRYCGFDWWIRVLDAWTSVKARCQRDGGAR